MSGPGGIGGNRPVNTGYTAPTQGAGQVKQPGMEFVQDLVLGGKVRTAQAQTPGKSFTETMGAAFTSMGASVTSFFKGLGDRMATIEMPSLPRISLRRQEAAQPEAAQAKAAEPPHKQANERLKETYSKPSSATFCELFTLRAAEAGGRVPLADVNLDGLGKAIAKKIETESKGGKNPVSEATAHAIAQTQIDKFIGTKNALLDVVAARNLPLAEAAVVNRFALQAEIRNPQALNAALDLRGSISTLFGQLQDPTLSRGDLIGALCEYQRAYDAALQPLVMGKTAEEFGADDIVSFASDALELAVGTALRLPHSGFGIGQGERLLCCRLFAFERDQLALGGEVLSCSDALLEARDLCASLVEALLEFSPQLKQVLLAINGCLFANCVGFAVGGCDGTFCIGT